MPAKVPTSRSAKTSASGTRKPATASRASPAVEVPEDTPETALRTQICAIFRDAQKSTAGHRKLAINLRKIQEACCYEPSNGKKSTGAEDFEEDDFNYEVARCIIRAMPVKKSETVGERVIRFVGLFLRHATEKDNELISAEDQDAGIMVETPSTRLTAQVMTTILPLMSAKEKFVRFRSTQLISHLINSLDSMDDDLFQLLRLGLLKRIRDKEAMVRVQAVLGLGRLAGNEIEGDANSEDSDEGPGTGLLDKLLDILQNDPSADVRRSLLVNLPILPNTLPFLLERARDQDPATRRALYSRLLPALGDFRHLSLSMREKILRWGLRDRDENVRKAAGKLFRNRWIEDCARIPEQTLAPNELSPPNFDGLQELLERIDVVNSGVENGVALEAMRGFWEGRADYREAVPFDDHFWDSLSAESVFMARSFNDYCMSSGDPKSEALVEDKMPEVTKLAFYLQRYINLLSEALKRVALQDEDEEEEDTVEQEFIVEQLLHIAQALDYTDEVGRRKMFSLLRQSLAIPDLTEEITRLIVEVLRGICAGDAAGEREFISVVLEAVADIHDTIMDEPADEPAEGDAEDSFHSALSEVSNTENASKKPPKEPLSEEKLEEKAVKEIMVNMKCLHIVQCMLQNVEGSLQQNVDLVAMLNNLVVPAVRSHEAPVRERGLLCLGLCSLLDKSLAEENLTLFMHFFSKGHAALQITALQILTDILTQHGAYLLDDTPPLLKVYLKALRNGSKGPDVQAVATVSVCKLMLGRVIHDSEAANDLLKTLIVSYFDPSTQANQGVRQALSYFLPVYSYSRKENQERMRIVAMDALHALYNVQEGLDDEEDDTDMVSLSTIGAHLVDWTDPRKCFVPGNALSLSDEGPKKAVNGDVHLDLASDILERLNGHASKEEKKVLAPLLGKLHISPASSEDKLREVYNEVSIAVDDKLVADATGRNALLKIHVSLGKIVNSLGKPQTVNSNEGRESAMPESRTSAEKEEEESKREDGDKEVEEADNSTVTTKQEEAEQNDTTTIPEEGVEESTLLGETTTLATRPKQTQGQRDSLVNELLSDEEDEEL